MTRENGLKSRLDDRGLAFDETLPPSATLNPYQTGAAPPDSFEWMGALSSLGAQHLPPLAVSEEEGVACDFRVLERLGRGGMGTVHLARQESLRREVAVKRLRPDTSNESTRQALIHEALVTGSLEHPNIVPIHALGRVDEAEPMLVMKRVEGVSWQTLIQQPEREAYRGHRPDRLRRHLDILKQVAQAVHFAHSRGVIHRDLKPENVMLGEYGEVYVVDWGGCSARPRGGGTGEGGAGRYSGLHGAGDGDRGGAGLSPVRRVPARSLPARGSDRPAATPR